MTDEIPNIGTSFVELKKSELSNQPMKYRSDDSLHKLQSVSF